MARVVLIGIAGAAIAAAAFGLSRTDGQLLSAFLLVLALLMVPITAGAVIASLYAAWQDAPLVERQRPAARPGDRRRCGICHRKLIHAGGLWLCPSCDRFAVERLS